VVFAIILYVKYYSSNLIGCGGVLTNRQGILLSPRFPNNYENNLRCNYTINMDPQHFIILSFDPDNFELEGK
jgi:hypothetical protein